MSGYQAAGMADVIISGRGRAVRREAALAPPSSSSFAPPISPTADATPGFIPSAITARVVPLTLGQRRGSVLAAAQSFGENAWSSRAEESPLARLKITPGVLVLTRTSVRQIVRAEQLARLSRDAMANAAGLFLAEDENWRRKDLPPRSVAAWSGKSRANMVKTFASLDWSPITGLADQGRLPAMVTLTYPSDWETVAPDGRTLKQHVRVWLLRYKRAWGESVAGAWKLEFQGRGAPHVHIFMAPPHGRARGRGVGAGLVFRHWLSAVWADVVNHPDAVEYMKHLSAGTAVDYAEALKCEDPKRLAIYFGKHGQYRTKEYQHIVPEPWQAPGKGPGRFWGYWGMKPLVQPVNMRPGDYKMAARILRRYSERTRVWDKSAGQWQWTRTMASVKGKRKDVDLDTGEVIWRKHRRRMRVRRFASGSGFLLANDAPGLAVQLARALEVCRS